MTEKRFEVVIDSNNDKSIWDYKTEEPLIALIVSDNHRKIYGIDECCKLLNQLNDENEQLKDDLNELKEIGDYQTKRIKELTEENEQLKSEIKMLKTTIGRNDGYIDRVTHKGEWKTYGDYK